jgi:hypothetical protein
MCVSGVTSLDLPEDLTRLLQQWGEGNIGSRDRLMTAVYGELRRLAGNYLRRERAELRNTCWTFGQPIKDCRQNSVKLFGKHATVIFGSALKKGWFDLMEGNVLKIYSLPASISSSASTFCRKAKSSAKAFSK